ncbi:MAG TPA: ATP-binding protein [Desulfomonilia bacterium]|nr:ATP-binding protein [Desulfomonilia bacterium]HRV34565.1 ATP-binding protein [Desulfomonilia bacterium]
MTTKRNHAVPPALVMTCAVVLLTVIAFSPAYALPGGWEEHRGWIIGIAAFGGFVLGLIVAFFLRKDGRETGLCHEDLERLVRERTALLEAEVEKGRISQEALARSEADLKMVQEVAVVGGWSLDLRTNKLTWTDGVYEVFGLPRGTPLDYEKFLSLVYPDDVEYVNRSWNDALKGARYDIEHRILVDGAVKWVREKARVEFSDSGTPLRGLGIVQDITGRKQAEQEQYILRRQLTHVSRLTPAGELTAALAHEISQPLAAILANAQAARHILNDEKPDMDELHAILDDIISDDTRAREVIKRIRSLLRKESAKSGRMDINRVIEDALKLVERESRFRRITVRSALAQGLPPVTADPIQIGQVVVNLVLNAMDAIGEDSEPPRDVTVESRMNGETEIVVSVRDTGKGIGEEALRSVFDPFYTTKEDGLGLGLAISRSIIESHGGRLSAADNPGRGATFSFSLPVMGKEA